MASEVPRVPPPSSKEGGKKETESATPDKFKKLMVEKVDETAADQKKQKKRRGQGLEAGEEEDAAAAQAPGTQPPPFRTESSKLAASPFEVQAPSSTPKTPAGAAPAPSPLTTPPPSAPKSTPTVSSPQPPQEEQDENISTTTPYSSPSDADTLGNSAPTVSPFSTAPTAPNPTQPTAPAQSTQKSDEDKSKNKTSPLSTSAKIKGAAGVKGGVEKPVGGIKKTDKGTAETTKATSKEEKEVFFKQLAKTDESGKTPVKINEEIAEEAAQAASLSPTPTPLSAPSKKESDEKKEAIAATTGAVLGDGSIATPLSLEVPSTSTTPPAYAYLDRQTLDLYERMVGVMTVMTIKGDNEITIQLTGEKFASSIFFGSQIIIKEYSTAPKAYNIELSVPNSAAAALAEKGTADLMAAFQNGVKDGQYNFRVNRFETRVKTDIVTKTEGSTDKGHK